MKKHILRAASCIITALLTVLMLCGLTDLTERKTSDQKYKDFFERPDEYDVLFMGSSHVINAVFPMELYKDFGITSYNFGGHSNKIATSYWVMENALDTCTPKVVVVDCLEVEKQIKCSPTFSFVHQSLDAFPLSLTKIRAVADLLDDPYLEEELKNQPASRNSESRTKLGLLWDYSVYHSRWNELSKNDFEPELLYEKGAESRINVVRNQLNRISPDEVLTEETVNSQYLRMIIEDCRSRGIDVLLTYLPFPAAPSQQKGANTVYNIAAEYGVNYLNFLDLDLIDYQTDLYDSDSHLNPSGARKVTAYLGEYLTENYGIPDRRTDETCAQWQADLDNYDIMKDKNLISCSKITNYLMLLSGDDIEIVFNIGNKDILKNTWIADLFENLGVDSAALSDDTDFIIVGQRGSRTAVLNDFRSDGKSADTALGSVMLVSSEDEGEFELLIDGKTVLNGCFSDDTGMRIAVFRNDELVDSVRFSYTVSGGNFEVNTSEVTR